MKLFKKRSTPRKGDGAIPSEISPMMLFDETTFSTPTKQGSCSAAAASPNNRSLASGSFSQVGSVNAFCVSPSRKSAINNNSDVPDLAPCLLNNTATAAAVAATPVVVFKRRASSFLRVADLQMDETMSLYSDETDSDGTTAVIGATASSAIQIIHPNFHHVATNPPPGVKEDPAETWVVLDDGAGNHAPIAPIACRALAQFGMASALNEKMWTPGDSKTAKLIKCATGWPSRTWNCQDGNVDLTGNGDAMAVLVWTGSFQHGLYGSDLPAVRVAGVIDMSPESLVDLLVDSSRVKEYNKLSLGRTDELVLQDTMEGPFGGITKVMKSESRPPLLRKTLQFISILHVTELADGSGYLMVSRAVTTPEEEKPKLQNVLKSEILMGVNIIKRVAGDENRCLIVSVNHIRSPMVPLMIAKRIGLQAAGGFISDIRACA